MSKIGVVGASGAVGSSILRHLRLAGVGSLRLGGRRLEALQQVATPDDDIVAFDLADAKKLEAFCVDCDVVVNAAGPTDLVMDRIALSALKVGAGYVDVAGDEPVFEALSGNVRSDDAYCVLSAGIMPGLTALLPRYVAADLDNPKGLVAFIGGMDRFTKTAARDYVASLRNQHGLSSAAWRSGRALRTLKPIHDAEVHHFPRPVSAMPYLSQENERVAQQLCLASGDWYNVFEGQHIKSAFAEIQHLLSAGDAEEAADLLCRAAELDVSGRRPYKVLSCIVEDEHRSQGVVLRTFDGYELSGAIASFAALDVRDGKLPAGLSFAGEVMEPKSTIERLSKSPSVAAIESFDASQHLENEPAYEDGAI